MLISNKKNDKVGNYQIGEMLGKGAFGTVMKGLNQETGQTVAIKQVRMIQQKKEERLKSIQSEINFLKKLKHQNIVKYIDFIQTETHYNIILEYIEGGSLANIIKKFGPFSEQLVSIYVQQVLQGLVYLHKQGIVHRDIKGANILTTKNGIIKLTDFGVATRLENRKNNNYNIDDNEKKTSYSFVGTPYWMAPEVIQQIGHISTSCDIWSLGCTVIELLTENPPYQNQNIWAAINQIVSDQHPPLPEGISPLCEDFLLKCFEKEPTLRIDAESLLKHDWIRSQNQKSQVQEIYNSSEIPEEVQNMIKQHLKSSSEQQQEVQPFQQFQGKQQGVGNLVNLVSLGQNSQVLQEKSQCLQEKFRLTKMKDDLLESQDFFQAKQQQQSKVRDYNAEFGLYSYFREFSGRSFWGGAGSVVGTIKYDTLENSTDKKILDFGVGVGVGGGGVGGSFVSMEGAEVGSSVSFDSLVKLKQFKKRFSPQRCVASEEQQKIKQRQDTRLFREIFDVFQQLESWREKDEFLEERSAELISLIQFLGNLLKSNEKARYYLMREFGLSEILGLLETCSEDQVLIEILSLINQIVENDSILLENACLQGALQAVNKFSGPEWNQSLRVESAYFIGMLCYAGPATLQMLLVAGGNNSFIEFLESDFQENRDLVFFALDAIKMVFDSRVISSENWCRQLHRAYAVPRIILVLDSLFNESYLEKNNHKTQNNANHENIQKYLLKTLEIITEFSRNQRKAFSQDTVVSLIMRIFKKSSSFSLGVLGQIIKVVKYIAQQISVLNQLENEGLVGLTIDLLKRTVDGGESQEILVADLLKLLVLLTNFSAPRQEQLALHNAVPILIELAQASPPRKEVQIYAVNILLSLVQTSALTRQKLWEVGGPRIYLKFLSFENMNSKVLDSLSYWLEIENLKVSSIFQDPQIVSTLIQSLVQADRQTFQEIVPLFSNLIAGSPHFAEQLSKNKQFFDEIISRITNTHQNSDTQQQKINPSSIVIKDILTILLQLSLQQENPQKLINENGIYQLIVQILKQAQNDEILILEEIANQLLSLYHNKNSFKN